MLNPDTWQPPLQTVTLAELTRSTAYALFRLRTYADKPVAHLGVGDAHSYRATEPGRRP